MTPIYECLEYAQGLDCFYFRANNKRKCIALLRDYINNLVPGIDVSTELIGYKDGNYYIKVHAIYKNAE